MKILQRNIVGGYYLLDKPTILRGIEYLHATNCGMVGDKYFVHIKFSPDEYPDTQGRHQESFDMSAYDGDEIASHPLFINAALEREFTTADLTGFAPSARERVLASIADGMSVFDAAVMHIARLIPEYCGATFQEVIEYRPELLVISKDADGNESQNINRCSVE